MPQPDNHRDLEQSYRLLILDEQPADSLDQDEVSLEQPHVGRIVPSFTTYSVDDDLASF